MTPLASATLVPMLSLPPLRAQAAGEAPPANPARKHTDQGLAYDKRRHRSRPDDPQPRHGLRQRPRDPQNGLGLREYARKNHPEAIEAFSKAIANEQ